MTDCPICDKRVAAKQEWMIDYEKIKKLEEKYLGGEKS